MKREFMGPKCTIQRSTSYELKKKKKKHSSSIVTKQVAKKNPTNNINFQYQS